MLDMKSRSFHPPKSDSAGDASPFWGPVENICFGDIRIDLRRREILRRNRRVHVECKVYNLLVHMAMNYDRAISQWELHLKLWQGRPVSSTVLARCIMKARQAVGDNSRSQKVIMTINRFGYRFVARVHAC